MAAAAIVPMPNVSSGKLDRIISSFCVIFELDSPEKRSKAAVNFEFLD